MWPFKHLKISAAKPVTWQGLHRMAELNSTTQHHKKIWPKKKKKKKKATCFTADIAITLPT